MIKYLMFNLSTKMDAAEETIGVIIYGYRYNTMNNYCIYTYDSEYDEFVQEICDAYTKNEDEYLIGNKIILKSELDTIKWILNGISNYAISFDNLDGLFESIDLRDETCWFNYEELLTNDEGIISILDLNTKKLDSFRRGYGL
jgi:hypothetical protein